MSTRCVTIKNGCLRLYFLETALASEMASAMTVRFVTLPVRLNPVPFYFCETVVRPWCSITNTVNPLLSSPLSNNPPASNKPPFSEEEN